MDASAEFSRLAMVNTAVKTTVTIQGIVQNWDGDKAKLNQNINHSKQIFREKAANLPEMILASRLVIGVADNWLSPTLQRAAKGLSNIGAAASCK